MSVSQTESLQTLTALLPKGTDVYVIQRHISQSGMLRRLSVVVPTDNGIRDITYHVANVLGMPLKRDFYNSVAVRGAGMDMHFHLVYTLSSALHDGDGYALNKVTL